MIIRNYKFSIVTLIFFPLLVAPFILKTINKKLEPYPAAIFPSAPSKVKIDNSQIILTRKKFYGKPISDKNIWVELPHQEFCFPLSVNFCRYLYKTKFGQEKLERKINLPFYKLVLPEKISDKEIELSKNYFKERLISLGFDEKQIMYRIQKISYDPKLDKIRFIGKSREKFFKFD